MIFMIRRNGGCFFCCLFYYITNNKLQAILVIKNKYILIRTEDYAMVLRWERSPGGGAAAMGGQGGGEPFYKRSLHCTALH